MAKRKNQGDLVHEKILGFHKKTFYATVWILILTAGILYYTFVLVKHENSNKEQTEISDSNNKLEAPHAGNNEMQRNAEQKKQVDVKK